MNIISRVGLIKKRNSGLSGSLPGLGVNSSHLSGAGKTDDTFLRENLEIVPEIIPSDNQIFENTIIGYNNWYGINTNVMPIVLELPSGLARQGDIIKVTDVTGNASTFNITIDFTTNGHKLYGQESEDYIVNVDGATVLLYYWNSDIGWIIETY